MLSSHYLLVQPKIFVNRYAKLVLVSSLEIRKMKATTASLHSWYAMLWCFLRNTDSGVDVFLFTASLPHNMSVGSSSDNPNMRRLYCNAITNSTASLSAVNLDPKVDVSTKFYFLTIHITGSWWQNINMPVCDCLVNLSEAWYAYSNQCV